MLHKSHHRRGRRIRHDLDVNLARPRTIGIGWALPRPSLNSNRELPFTNNTIRNDVVVNDRRKPLYDISYDSFGSSPFRRNFYRKVTKPREATLSMTIDPELNFYNEEESARGIDFSYNKTKGSAINVNAITPPALAYAEHDTQRIRQNESIKPQSLLTTNTEGSKSGHFSESVLINANSREVIQPIQGRGQSHPHGTLEERRTLFNHGRETGIAIGRGFLRQATEGFSPQEIQLQINYAIEHSQATEPQSKGHVVFGIMQGLTECLMEIESGKNTSYMDISSISDTIPKMPNILKYQALAYGVEKQNEELMQKWPVFGLFCKTQSKLSDGEALHTPKIFRNPRINEMEEFAHEVCQLKNLKYLFSPAIESAKLLDKKAFEVVTNFSTVEPIQIGDLYQLSNEERDIANRKYTAQQYEEMGPEEKNRILLLKQRADINAKRVISYLKSVGASLSGVMIGLAQNPNATSADAKLAMHKMLVLTGHFVESDLPEVRSSLKAMSDLQAKEINNPIDIFEYYFHFCDAISTMAIDSERPLQCKEDLQRTVFMCNIIKTQMCDILDLVIKSMELQGASDEARSDIANNLFQSSLSAMESETIEGAARRMAIPTIKEGNQIPVEEEGQKLSMAEIKRALDGLSKSMTDDMGLSQDLTKKLLKLSIGLARDETEGKKLAFEKLEKTKMAREIITSQMPEDEKLQLLDTLFSSTDDEIINGSRINLHPLESGYSHFLPNAKLIHTELSPSLLFSEMIKEAGGQIKTTKSLIEIKEVEKSLMDPRILLQEEFTNRYASLIGTRLGLSEDIGKRIVLLIRSRIKDKRVEPYTVYNEIMNTLSSEHAERFEQSGGKEFLLSLIHNLNAHSNIANSPQKLAPFSKMQEYTRKLSRNGQERELNAIQNTIVESIQSCANELEGIGYDTSEVRKEKIKEIKEAMNRGDIHSRPKNVLQGAGSYNAKPMLCQTMMSGDFADDLFDMIGTERQLPTTRIEADSGMGDQLYSINPQLSKEFKDLDSALEWRREIALAKEPLSIVATASLVSASVLTANLLTTAQGALHEGKVLVEGFLAGLDTSGFTDNSLLEQIHSMIQSGSNGSDIYNVFHAWYQGNFGNSGPIGENVVWIGVLTDYILKYAGDNVDHIFGGLQAFVQALTAIAATSAVTASIGAVVSIIYVYFQTRAAQKMRRIIEALAGSTMLHDKFIHLHDEMIHCLQKLSSAQMAISQKQIMNQSVFSSPFDPVSFTENDKKFSLEEKIKQHMDMLSIAPNGDKLLVQALPASTTEEGKKRQLLITESASNMSVTMNFLGISKKLSRISENELEFMAKFGAVFSENKPVGLHSVFDPHSKGNSFPSVGLSTPFNEEGRDDSMLFSRFHQNPEHKGAYYRLPKSVSSITHKGDPWTKVAKDEIITFPLESITTHVKKYLFPNEPKTCSQIRANNLEIANEEKQKALELIPNEEKEAYNSFGEMLQDAINEKNKASFIRQNLEYLAVMLMKFEEIKSNLGFVQNLETQSKSEKKAIDKISAMVGGKIATQFCEMINDLQNCKRGNASEQELKASLSVLQNQIRSTMASICACCDISFTPETLITSGFLQNLHAITNKQAQKVENCMKKVLDNLKHLEDHGIRILKVQSVGLGDRELSLTATGVNKLRTQRALGEQERKYGEKTSGTKKTEGQSVRPFVTLKKNSSKERIAYRERNHEMEGSLMPLHVETVRLVFPRNDNGSINDKTLLVSLGRDRSYGINRKEKKDYQKLKNIRKGCGLEKPKKPDQKRKNLPWEAWGRGQFETL